MTRLFSTITLLGLFLSGFSQDLQVNQFSSGFNKPIGIENCGDDRLFILEQPGIIRILNEDGTQENTPFLDIRSKIRDRGNEQGLLGLAFHPKYSENGYFFLNYSGLDGQTVIARYTVSNDENVADASSEKVLMEVDQPYANHNGGCIQFGNDGYLYIGMGDGGAGGDPKNSGQDKQSLLGKMLRIDIDSENGYAIPESNPFADTEEILDEVWALGVRNPWKFCFDGLSGDMWIADVGQNKWEEIDYQPGNSAGGENYGWRCYEGSQAFNTTDCEGSENYVGPVYEYANNSNMGCSVTGGYVYRGSKYKSLAGRYLFTDFCSGNIWATTKNGTDFSTDRLGKFQSNNYGAFGQDQYGELYLAERQTGRIMKISTDECKPSAFIWVNGSSTVLRKGEKLRAGYHPDNSYQWYKNGDLIDGATTHELLVTETGKYSVKVINEVDCEDTSEEVEVTDIVTSIDAPKDLEIDLRYAQESLQISTSRQVEVSDISVFDMSGKEVYRMKTGVSDLYNVPVGRLEKSRSYVVKLTTNEGVISEVFQVM